jgi:predicted site-specific integrase-resolvase
MPRVYNLAQAAERLGMSPCSLRQLVKAGTVRPARLLKGKLLFSEAALEEAVRDAEQAAATAPADGRGKQTTPDLHQRRGAQ